MSPVPGEIAAEKCPFEVGKLPPVGPIPNRRRSRTKVMSGPAPHESGIMVLPNLPSRCTWSPSSKQTDSIHTKDGRYLDIYLLFELRLTCNNKRIIKFDWQTFQQVSINGLFSLRERYDGIMPNVLCNIGRTPLIRVNRISQAESIDCDICMDTL